MRTVAAAPGVATGVRAADRAAPVELPQTVALLLGHVAIAAPVRSTADPSRVTTGGPQLGAPGVPGSGGGRAGALNVAIGEVPDEIIRPEAVVGEPVRDGLDRGGAFGGPFPPLPLALFLVHARFALAVLPAALPDRPGGRAVLVDAPIAHDAVQVRGAGHGVQVLDLGPLAAGFPPARRVPEEGVVGSHADLPGFRETPDPEVLVLHENVSGTALVALEKVVGAGWLAGSSQIPEEAVIQDVNILVANEAK